MATCAIRSRSFWVGAVLLVGSVGCGLTEYENRMLQTQNLYQHWEEESRLLDLPVGVPFRTDEKAGPVPVASVYFRPPKGINNGCANPKDPRNRLFYTYQPRAVGAAGPFYLVELAFADLDSKDFATEVMRSFGPANNPVTRQRQIKAPGREALTFQTTEFSNGTYFYSINIWKGQRTQAAIAYWVFQNKSGQAVRPIEVSLQSFAAEDKMAAAQARGDPLKSFGKPPR